MSADLTRAWRARPPQDLIWLALDGDYVLYHRPSGKTHVINAASTRLLRDVLAEPKTTAEAAEELAAHEGAAADAAFVASVSDALVQLDHLGLIDRL